jgi:hypothetical protein
LFNERGVTDDFAAFELRLVASDEVNEKQHSGREQQEQPFLNVPIACDAV